LIIYGFQYHLKLIVLIVLNSNTAKFQLIRPPLKPIHSGLYNKLVLIERPGNKIGVWDTK